MNRFHTDNVDIENRGDLMRNTPNRLADGYNHLAGLSLDWLQPFECIPCTNITIDLLSYLEIDA